jgi:hypothetical protein
MEDMEFFVRLMRDRGSVSIDMILIVRIFAVGF